MIIPKHMQSHNIAIIWNNTAWELGEENTVLLYRFIDNWKGRYKQNSCIAPADKQNPHVPQVITIS